MEPEPQPSAAALRRAKWQALFAVWSAPVAWLVLVVLVVALAPDPPQFESTVGSGLALVCVGVVGLFVVVPLALRALDSRGKLLYPWLNLLGVLVGLIGYGGMVLAGGFVLLLSPFAAIDK